MDFERIQIHFQSRWWKAVWKEEGLWKEKAPATMNPLKK